MGILEILWLADDTEPYERLTTTKTTLPFRRIFWLRYRLTGNCPYSGCLEAHPCPYCDGGQGKLLHDTQDFWWALAMLMAATLWLVMVMFYPMAGMFWWGLMELDGMVHFSSAVALVLLLGRKRWWIAVLLLLVWEAVEGIWFGYSPFESFWMVMDSASDIVIGVFGILMACLQEPPE